MIVQAGLDTAACYGAKKLAEIIFSREKMVKGERLVVLDERMKSLDPDLNESYKFLRCKQAEGIKADVVYQRVSKEMEKRIKAHTGILQFNYFIAVCLP